MMVYGRSGRPQSYHLQGDQAMMVSTFFLYVRAKVLPIPVYAACQVNKNFIASEEQLNPNK